MIDSRCGLHCSSCTYKEPHNCKGCIETNGHPFHGECPVANCCQGKGFTHCGECPDIPCELLTQYSCDPEHGDSPAGARIEQCKKWADKIYSETTGIVISAKKQWWFKVNTKAFRHNSLDGAVFPYIVKIKYSVNGKDYTKSKWISAGFPVPQAGSLLTVKYRNDNPKKSKIL